MGKIVSMKAGVHRIIRRKVDLGGGRKLRVVPARHSIGEGDIMKCHRCNGMMIYEKFYGDSEYFMGWRCVTCGEIVDETILENRLQSIQ